MKNQFFTKQKGVLIPCTNIETYGYYQAGFQHESDKGKLSTLEFISGAGTCLVPVFDKDGNQIINTEFAGKYYNEVFNPKN